MSWPGRQRGCSARPRSGSSPDRLGVRPSQAARPELRRRRRDGHADRRAGRPGAGDVVLEVGPGLGSLTLPLLERRRRPGGRRRGRPGAGRRAAADRRRPGAGLAGRLARGHRGRGRIARALPRRAADGPGREPALQRGGAGGAAPAGGRCPALRRGLVMVQAEVADRMCAGPAAGPTACRRSSSPGTGPRGGPGRCRGPCSGRCRTSTPGWSRSPGRPGRGRAGDGWGGRAARGRCSRSSTRRSRSGARRCGRRWRAGRARRRPPSDVLRAAGVDPALRGEALGVARVRPDCRGRSRRKYHHRIVTHLSQS